MVMVKILMVMSPDDKDSNASHLITSSEFTN